MSRCPLFSFCTMKLSELYSDLNSQAFDGKLPTIPVFYNKKLKSTAGKFKFAKGKGFIEISPNVCRDAGQVKETLAHEMCHAAQKFVDKVVKPRA